MCEWATIRLRDLCESVDYGLTASSSSEPIGPKFLRITDIVNGYPHWSSVPFVDASPGQINRYRLEHGDIVIARTGATTGRSRWICQPPDAIFASYLIRLKVRQEVDSRFLGYLLQSNQFLDFVNGVVGGTSAQPNASATTLTSAPLRIPVKKDYQEAIAEVLGALDDKIAVNDRIESTYESLLALRFGQLEIDADSDGSVVAADLIEFNPRTKAPTVDAVYLEMSALPTASARIREWSRREPKSGARFANGDTVMARITPCLENGKTGFVDFMRGGEVGVGSTEFIVMRARAGVPVHLPYFLARSPRFRSIAIQNMVGSSGRQRVSASSLESVAIRRPREDELLRFDAEASAAFAHMRSLGQESANLAGLRDALLPKLMSGEIRVRDAEKAVEDAL